jgi:hypothetical protein
MQEGVPLSRKLHKSLGIAPAWGIFLYYICSRKHRRAADLFFQQLDDGLGIPSRNSSIFHLRKTLWDNVKSTKKLRPEHVGAFVIKAWNAECREEILKVYKWRTEQSPNEIFPRAG